MPPAARVTDMHTCPMVTGLVPHVGGPLLPPGVPTVLIGGLPAWRALGDFHACPLVTGVVPHVGGIVQPGSLTVRINGLPAARAGDLIIEAGPPNAIAAGLPTVNIGG